jgi:hypothetical protein
MVEIPVQDAGRPQQADLVELKPHRPRGEADAVRHPDQVLQRRAAQREAEAPPERRRIGAVAVIARDHREAGEAAFRRLGLQHHRQPPPPAKSQALDPAHASLLPVSECSGSSTHS